MFLLICNCTVVLRFCRFCRFRAVSADCCNAHATRVSEGALFLCNWMLLRCSALALLIVTAAGVTNDPVTPAQYSTQFDRTVGHCRRDGDIAASTRGIYASNTGSGLAACLQACLDDPACVAVDNEQGDDCRIHTGAGSTGVNAIFANSGYCWVKTLNVPASPPCVARIRTGASSRLLRIVFHHWQDSAWARAVAGRLPELGL